MRNIFGRLKNQRGQAIVEMAIAIPVLITVLVCILEFGGIFHNYLVVTHAAREGARSAALRNTDSIIISTAEAAAPSIQPGELNVDIEPPVRTVGQPVTVTVSREVPIFTSIIKNALELDDYKFTVQGVAVMRVE
jgi:Flp pilus assembly protein TadG